MSIQQELNEADLKIAEEIREILVDSLLTQRPQPLATGRLASSIEVRPDGNGGFDIYAEDYALVVENGRQGRGKWPPIKPIMDWVRAKGIKPPQPTQTKENLAWAIASRLRTSRIKPRPFIQDGIAQLDEKILNRLGLIIEKNIDKAFE